MNKSVFAIAFYILLSVLGLSAQEPISIAEVQGDRYFSPYVSKKVTVQGIVTALRKRGFYIQTPDKKADDNPRTSEGIYVFTFDPPTEQMALGSLVEVTGTVIEYRPKRERYALFLTEIIKPEVKIISTGNALPKPFLLTKKQLNPNGAIDQMERFEGMRIKIEDLSVVAPTGGFFSKRAGRVKSDGVFYGVLANTPRPFREPGLDGLMVLIDKLPPTLPTAERISWAAFRQPNWMGPKLPIRAVA